MQIRPCTVVLTDVGNDRVAVMAALREIRSDLSLREAKALIEKLPQVILQDVDAEEADRAAKILQRAGAAGRTEKPDLRTNIRDWLSTRCTIEEIEAEVGAAKADDERSGGEERPRPRVFQELERQFQPGDEIWRFSSPAVFWENLCGRAGYAIVRAGDVVYTVLTAMN